VRTFSRYLARGIYGRVGFVLLGFVALFALFDFVSELEEIGRGEYRMAGALQFIMLRVPAMAYELLPIACLIGGLWALPAWQLPQSSRWQEPQVFGPLMH
jgi:Predicted permeases